MPRLRQLANAAVQAESAALNEAVLMWRTRAEQAEAALQQAREALKHFGVHKDCRKTSILSPSTKCSCGFDAALKGSNG